LRSSTAALIAPLAAALVAGCGSGSAPPAHGKAGASDTATAHRVSARVGPVRPPGPPYPQLLGAAASSGPTNFVPAMRWHGQTAVWLARQGGVSLLSFNQQLVTLRLHSGTIDAGPGYPWGPSIAGGERRHVVAAFNSAFKLDVGAGGFMLDGHVAAPLRAGLGSVVTYRNGYTDIGAWQGTVPAPGRPIESVRQNLQLLISGGRPASNVDCLLCWGATLGGTSTPARSAIGITADGRLIWAGGENLTVTALVDALLAAHVVRAVELDINPEWVAAYLYGHRNGRGPLAPVPIVAGQPGVPGQFLTPYSRDFFSIVTR
jgi:hypothetical protein